MRGSCLSFAVAASVFAASAHAQTPPQYAPPPQPPPGYEQQQPYPVAAPPPYYQPQMMQQQGPKVMDYEEGQAVPPGYHVEARMRKGMVIGGAATLGALWLVSICAGALATAVASIDNDGRTASQRYTPLYIPVAGPFITMGTAHSDASGTFALAILGAGQVLGASLLVVGLASPQDKLVRNDVGAFKPKIWVSPVVTANSGGFGLKGSF